jgi:short-subunit dehydrogenase
VFIQEIMKNSPAPKVIIITGASSGIGAATARRLAKNGWRLTLAARRLDRLKQVAEDVQSSGGEALIVQMDVRNHDDIQRMVAVTLERWERIDVLINNAGVGHDVPLLRMPSERIRDTIHINLTAVIECSQAVLPEMIRQKSGHIINVASFAGLVAVPGSAVYSATKFGVNGFSDALRRELLGKGIAISAFCPGYTPSEISPALKAIADGRADAPTMPGLMPVSYVADQIARLIDHPRLRVVIPIRWRPLALLGSLFPAITDKVIPFFRGRRKK